MSQVEGQNYGRIEGRVGIWHGLAKVEKSCVRPTMAVATVLCCLLSATALISGPASAQAPTCQGSTVTVDLAVGDSATPDADVILGTPGVDTINGLGGDDIICALGGNDNVYGGPGNDTIYGGGGNDWIAGGPGADTIFGQIGGDTINGGGDNDVLLGGPGFDVLYGNDGDDNVQGAGGNDTMYGGAGDDDMYGKPGDDIMHGGPGADEMYGAAGDDTMNGDGGDDQIQGAAGDDTLDGGDGNDILWGQGGGDTLRGQDGDDTMYGAGGNDDLDGGIGADNLQGASGDDRLTGGAGADSLFGGPGNDLFEDGRTSEDTCFDPDQNNLFICLTEQPPRPTLNLTFENTFLDFGEFPPASGLSVEVRPAVTTTTTIATAMIPDTVATVAGSSCAQLLAAEPTAVNCTENTTTRTLADSQTLLASAEPYTDGSIEVPVVDFFLSVSGNTPDPYCWWSASSFEAIPANQQEVTLEVAIICA